MAKTNIFCECTLIGAIDQKDYVAAYYTAVEVISLNTGPILKQITPISHQENEVQV